MKIYTKTGDKGTTRLVDGSCVEKFNPRVEAYGSVDELNSGLGVVRSHLKQNVALVEIDVYLEKIQSSLFSVGSLLATADEKVFYTLTQIEDAQISELEKWIDLYTEPLPALKNFILPGGHLIASYLHVSRTACRRAERRTSEMMSREKHYQNVLIYLNRLSDLLFTWARWVNFKTQQTETIWKKHD
ncbi:MAG: cob(I)yrinic acid a,c-diamide adenosyltransferase [Bdellovibrio sp.]|nr:cob(I)yrinic acid a,c-diamide adenosyltransferase [Bdellovibrio sp.]